MTYVRHDLEAAISHEIAVRMFHYDPVTGTVTWLVGKKRGRPIKYVCTDGYMRVKIINKRKFSLHRLIWLLVYKEWPKSHVDHEDGNGSNNAIRNLRLATNQQNTANTRLGVRNKSGFKGVVATRSGKFMAIIHHDRKQKYLGTFPTKELAAEAYAEAALRLFGEFARAA